MRTWLRGAGVVLGALLLGIIGATAGSWVGSLDPRPLPTDAEALRLTQEILPGVIPAGERDRRDYLYGSPLGDEQAGTGFVSISYEREEGKPGPSPDECRLDDQARTGATRSGWVDFRTVTGYSCDNWSAKRGDLAIAYTHDTIGSVVTFYRPTAGATLGMLIGAVAGALVGAAATYFLGRRRPRATLVILAVPALLLIPVTGLYIAGLISNMYEGPLPAFWTTWYDLARLFFPPSDY
ncbi:hypothetical protein AB0F72_01975 [Actinoplanes sp. NPDC023936]|uniref:hypothetical protein n=1 Tax=Actinoplanes sp. NPDC023936 TaxID=3154910 RepID=UPI0033C3859C